MFLHLTSVMDVYTAANMCKVDTEVFVDLKGLSHEIDFDNVDEN
jgi:hypothetical protein